MKWIFHSIFIFDITKYFKNGIKNAINVQKNYYNKKIIKYLFKTSKSIQGFNCSSYMAIIYKLNRLY